MDNSDEVRITLRLPAALRDRLAKHADAFSRSMNGEIIFRLDEYERLSEGINEIIQSIEEREHDLQERARDLKPREDLTMRLAEQAERITELREQIELQRIILRFNQGTSDLLNTILDEAERGEDATLKRTLANRKATLSPAEEKEMEGWAKMLSTAIKARAREDE